MFIKNIIVGMLAAFLCFGMIGTAFAGEGDYDSILGTDEFKFDAPVTKADIAARNYDYNQKSLAAVRTEAGSWEYKFDAPDTKADIAARNHDYNQDSLALVGTEAGDWGVKFKTSDTKASEAVANEGKKEDAVCTDC